MTSSIALHLMYEAVSLPEPGAIALASLVNSWLRITFCLYFLSYRIMGGRHASSAFYEDSVDPVLLFV